MSYTVHVLPWWPWNRWLAITLGTHILAKRPLSRRELTHEARHVYQWLYWGADYPPNYFLASFESWRAGTGWYWGNRFEVAARRAAGEAP